MDTRRKMVCTLDYSAIQATSKNMVPRSLNLGVKHQFLASLVRMPCQLASNVFSSPFFLIASYHEWDDIELGHYCTVRNETIITFERLRMLRLTRRQLQFMFAFFCLFGSPTGLMPAIALCSYEHSSRVRRVCCLSAL